MAYHRLKINRELQSEAQNHRCCYCGMLMYTTEQIRNFHKRPKFWYIHPCISMMDQLTFEHIIKKSDKGSIHWRNTVASCSLCNCLRKDKDPYEHFEWIQNNLEYIRKRKEEAYKRKINRYEMDLYKKTHKINKIQWPIRIPN